MKKIILIFSIIFSIFISAQTAKEIIDKSIENSGGLTNWKLLNTVQIQGRVTLGVNDEYPIKIYQQRPNLSKTAMVVAGKETPVEGYDGKNGYAMNYAQNKLQQYNDYIPENFDNDFIDWENKGFEAKFLGKEKINDQLYFKVELTKNVNKTIYYFDVKNYMLFREIKKDEILTYSDYRKVGNLLMSYRIESSSPKKDSDYVMTINKIEINKELPKNTFKFNFPMEVEEIREYCLNKKAVTEAFPFDQETLVFKVGGKIFVFLPIDTHPATFSAKADPEWSEELREKYHQINGAFHLNKTHWNSVVCEGLKQDFIFKLIDHSYDLVFKSLTKKIKEEINNS